MSKQTRPNLSAFLNPEPTNAGAFLDASNDIYDHTKDFFNTKTENPSGDVEVQYKTIRPDISDLNLDEKIYKAKKVSRAQMNEAEDMRSLEEGSYGSQVGGSDDAHESGEDELSESA